MKTVSFLIPTHNKNEWLFKALESIKATCRDLSDIEILLRIDDDDSAKLAISQDLVSRYPVRLVIGPRYGGYPDLGIYFDEMLSVSDSRWAWQFDDDFWLEGNWHEQLSALHCDPKTGPACFSEYYQLGGSKYPGPQMAGIIMPTATVKSIKNRCPIDDQWFMFSKAKGWPMHIMNGVTLFHEGRPR